MEEKRKEKEWRKMVVNKLRTVEYRKKKKLVVFKRMKIIINTSKQRNNCKQSLLFQLQKAMNQKKSKTKEVDQFFTLNSDVSVD